ncbi:type IX secretion system protein PorQ [Telluribacter sp. SYSU D00476]|uniref:type IX secretion system protein PorQ n=1 Tax=Telluribacter sp. SYSU D00476 TaxID=2811430 RepID=UPI001FF2BEB8|nr:type IX secretion system protein PorQ [Telluribacter sp. SYSU D00476]
MKPIVRYLKATVITTALLLGLAAGVQAQPTGGRTGLSFLQLPTQGRSSALGSYHLTLPGSDPLLFMHNPALLDSSSHQQLSLSLMPHLADTRFVNLAYAHSLPRTGGTWAAGVQYFHYGTMTQTDPTGTPTGEFRAADYAVTVGYGHTRGNITLGGSLKWLGSGIESYQLWGLALDWGAVFRHPDHDLTAGFVVKNMGFVRQNYGGGAPPPLPFDVRAGVTFKPTYMPLRFSVTAHHLYRFDMVYNDPALFYSFDANGNRVPRRVAIPEKLLRHLSAGAEILIHPRFRLMVGYDHLRRQELHLQNAGGLAGVTFGAWLRVSRFGISYGRAQYVPGLGTNTLSFNIDLKKE